MCGSIGRQSEQRIGEGFGGEFAVEGKSAVLGEGVRELQGIKLNICISVSKSLDQGGGRLCGARWVGRHAIADIENVFPILARKVFVRGLDYCTLLAIVPQPEVARLQVAYRSHHPWGSSARETWSQQGQQHALVDKELFSLAVVKDAARMLPAWTAC